ncbi:hypothetical protein LPW26_08080 [Rhodopseudomonas sp. HC1]|uniref:hypothetical protein n=1 Tax=Rhodopseudomonas infernalis TaxID=2897386 RepID=UPI001EE8DF66|nr:hypothetical protein [Rhodopseudomonas infernalis]MCG6204589.1 hypothetical protein [Rhodopseudomonas infernalis]
MRAQTLLRIWRWPLALAALIAAGLAAALLGNDAIWRSLSWAALAVPLIIIVIALSRGGFGRAR